MKRAGFLVLMAWALGTVGAEADEGVAEFHRIEKDRADSLRLADVEAIDLLYADDFVGISRTGQVVRKPELLRAIRERGVNDVTFAMKELEVRRIEGLAFVLGRLTGTDANGKVVREGRVLHVYAKREGRWKLVSAQATPLP